MTRLTPMPRESVLILLAVAAMIGIAIAVQFVPPPPSAPRSAATWSAPPRAAYTMEWLGAIN